MILLIDNYDSFTYNLVDYFGQLTDDVRVFRNDAISVAQIEALHPTGIVISPGPGKPNDSGISTEVVRQLGDQIPILGICLGHQCIGQVYGGEIVVGDQPVHGKVSPIKHNGDTLFNGLPDPFPATRYHSLVVKRETLPDELQIIAETEDRTIMAIKHKTKPVTGLQFHPESVLTTHGMQILKNWLDTIKNRS